MEVSSHGEIILKESLVDFVKPCHKKEYVAIFDVIEAKEDSNSKVCEFSNKACGKGAWHNRFSYGIHGSKLKSRYCDIWPSLFVCTWMSFERCLHALGGFWNLQIEWKILVSFILF